MKQTRSFHISILAINGVTLSALMMPNLADSFTEKYAPKAMNY